MGELSDRFAELMARMAKSDAELFRTIGEQNASVRQMVDDLVPPSEAPGAESGSGALSPAGLLPPEQCDQRALKARFGKVAEAQAWVEGRIGKAPKKPTWLIIQQTCLTGSWPLGTPKNSRVTKGITAEQLDERLTSLENRLNDRLDRLEILLRLIVQLSDSAQTAK